MNEGSMLFLLRAVLGITRVLWASVWDSLLTAFNLKGARLCVQGKSAEVHVAHCSHCNPTSKKTKIQNFGGCKIQMQNDKQKRTVP